MKGNIILASLLLLLALTPSTVGKENLRLEASDKEKFNIFEFITGIFWGNPKSKQEKDNIETVKTTSNEGNKTEKPRITKISDGKIKYNETPNILKEKENNSKLLDIQMKYDSSPIIDDQNHNVLFISDEANTNTVFKPSTKENEKVFKGKKEEVKMETPTIIKKEDSVVVESPKKKNVENPRELKKYEVPNANVTIYHSVPLKNQTDEEYKSSIHSTVHEIAKKVIDIKANKSTENPFSMVKLSNTTLQQSSDSLHFQQKKVELYSKQPSNNTILSNKAKDFEPVAIVRKISPYSKELLRQANDPDYKPPIDLRFESTYNRKLTGRNNEYTDSPSLIGNIVEDSIADITTAHHETEEKKALWKNAFALKYYKEVSFNGQNPEDPYQTVISKKDVGVKVSKNKEENEPSFDGVENHLVKAVYYDAKNSENFIPAQIKK